jgi:hypothetical protein
VDQEKEWKMTATTTALPKAMRAEFFFLFFLFFFNATNKRLELE